MQSEGPTKAQLIHELTVLRQRVAKLEQQELEYQQTEQALRASETRLAGILDITIEAIISLDEHQRIILFNKGAETLFGYSPEEVIGKSVDILIPKRFQKTHHQHITTFQQSETPSRRMAEREEVYGCRKSGEEFPAEASISKSHINKNTFFTVVLRDITERKIMEDSLRLLLEQRNQELEILLTASQQIAGDVQIDSLLHKVTDAIVTALPQAEAASLWLYDEQQHQLVARAWTGYSDEAMSELSISPERCMVGLVYRTAKARLFADVQNEEVYEPFARPDMDRIRSAIGVPLIARGQVLGVIFADNFSREAAFDDEDMRLLGGLAAQIAMAIQNVRLFRQLLTEREQTRHLAREVITAQESERRRVSRELHDEAGQALVLLKHGLQRMAGSREGLKQHINNSIDLTEQTMKRVRTLAYDLRPPLLDTLALEVVLEDYCEEFAERTVITVDYTGTSLPQLPDDIRITLYRFLQEALTNVVKHADADKIHVILDFTNNEITLSVSDNGNGFALKTGTHPTKPQGIGLVGMRERVQTVNGHLDVESEPGKGTQLKVHIPLENNL